MKVLFWRDAIVDITKFSEVYSGTIDNLIQGQYKSLHLEKLRVNSITPIYSIRHDSSTRILFTTYQGQICILEVILNHDYNKSRYLRNRHCLQNALEKISLDSPFHPAAQASFINPIALILSCSLINRPRCPPKASRLFF